jgi:hypothetical protein
MKILRGNAHPPPPQLLVSFKIYTKSVLKKTGGGRPIPPAPVATPLGFCTVAIIPNTVCLYITTFERDILSFLVFTPIQYNI